MLNRSFLFALLGLASLFTFTATAEAEGYEILSSQWIF